MHTYICIHTCVHTYMYIQTYCMRISVQCNNVAVAHVLVSWQATLQQSTESTAVHTGAESAWYYGDIRNVHTCVHGHTYT